MRSKVDTFLDLYPNFHELNQTDQILRIVFFFTVEEGHETISKKELDQLFAFARIGVPRNLPQLLAYLSGKGKKLLCVGGEYSLKRNVQKEIEKEVRSLRGQKPPPPPIGGVGALDFPGKNFKDLKVQTLLNETRICYSQACWNACGILVRIIVERTLDSVDPAVRKKQGLKDKINFCKGASDLFSKSLRDGMKELHNAKLLGDIAAHHSKILLDKSDIDLVLPVFRILIREVESI